MEKTRSDKGGKHKHGSEEDRTQMLAQAMFEHANLISSMSAGKNQFNDAHSALHSALDSIGIPRGDERAAYLGHTKGKSLVGHGKVYESSTRKLTK